MLVRVWKQYSSCKKLSGLYDEQYTFRIIPQISALMSCHCRAEDGKDGQIHKVGFFMYDP